jgi:hypothetical protein
MKKFLFWMIFGSILGFLISTLVMSPLSYVVLGITRDDFHRLWLAIIIIFGLGLPLIMNNVKSKIISSVVWQVISGMFAGYFISIIFFFDSFVEGWPEKYHNFVLTGNLIAYGLLLPTLIKIIKDRKVNKSTALLLLLFIVLEVVSAYLHKIGAIQSI